MMYGLAHGHTGLLKGTKPGLNGTLRGNEGWSLSSYDIDAWKYIQYLQNVAKVAIPQQWKVAINRFVVRGKAQGWWDNADVIYPYIGGTAAAHAVNLKNPGSRSITWNGTVTHSRRGVSGNAVNGYGDTGFNPVSGTNKFTQDAASVASYMVDTNADTFGGSPFTCGACTDLTTQISCIRVFGTTSIGTHVNSNSSVNLTSLPSVLGTSIGRRPDSNNVEFYFGGQRLLTSAIGSQPLNNFNMYVLGGNQAGAAAFLTKAIFGMHYFGGKNINPVDFSTEVENLQVVLGRPAFGG